MTNLLSDCDLLARLVGFDSSSQHSNRPIADFICDYLDRPGVRIDRQSSPDDDKVNVIARIGPDDVSGDGGLVLSGHMDTVPANEPEWESDPYTMGESDDHYYGRGVCDMKGFIALAMNAAAAERPSALNFPLVLVFTYDEEVGLLGSKHLAESYPDRGSLPKAAIVGEPTSLKVVRMHKGYVGFNVVVSGKSAHSGYPHLGENAIEPSASLIRALADLRLQLTTEEPPNAEHFPEVPFVALNVGTVNGGTAPNIIPDRCEIECTCRTLPGMDTGSLIQRIRDVTKASVGQSQYEFSVTNETPPLLLPEQSRINEVLADLVHQAETRSASYATDAGWLQTIGMECAVFGPGNIEVAHRPNEKLPVADFDACRVMLDRTINEFCRTA